MQQESINGYRLSPAQTRLWLAAQGGGADRQCVECVLLAEGTLNLAALETALRQAVRRHAVLRTTYQCLPGMTAPLQVILEEALVSVRLREIPGTSPQEEERALAAALAEERRSFGDSMHAPGLRADVFRHSATRYNVVLRLPALCIDPAGMRRLAAELCGSCLSVNGEEPMRDHPIEYVAVADWLNELTESADAGDGRRFWANQMAGRSLAVDIPFAANPVRGGFAPRVAMRELQPALRSALVDLAQQEQAPLSTLLLAAWLLLARRLSGQSEVAAWVACDGRVDDDFSGIIGCLERHIPLILPAGRDRSLREMLRTVAESLADIQLWRDYFPIDGGAGSATTGEFIADFAFAFADEPPELPSGQVRFSIRSEYACGEKFKLKLHCHSRPGSLRADFHYDSSRFSADDAERVARFYVTLLEGIVGNPAGLTAEVGILDRAEAEEVLGRFNATEADYGAAKTLAELFEEQAERSPDAIAVSDEAGRATYSELNGRANQLAHYLRSQNVGPEVLAGIYMERCVDMVVAILGILKVGGGYVPLDPEYPADRLVLMRKEAPMPVILTQAALADSLPGLAETRIIPVDGDQPAFRSFSMANPAPAACPENLAYVIFTSGSTGIPKGVMISHSAIANHMRWMQHRFPMGPGDRVLQKTPFSFDASVWEFFAPLFAGLELVMARPGGHRDGGYLAETIDRCRITTLQLVPSQLQLLLEAAVPGAGRSLQRVYCGGEPLTAAMRDRFHSQFSARLINLYGPTEATIDATCWESDAGKAAVVPIGKPVANTQIYVLDANLQPVPRGVSGELYIGGEGLGRGYLNSPDLTAARFLPDPFSRRPGLRIYRTGDRGAYVPDGNILCLGRIDHQVKIRGFRIELGEIETALTRHERIARAAVVVREEAGDKRLVAYIVAKDGAAVRAEELRVHLRGSLPEYMMPSVFVALDRLPLMPNGKVDRKALPEPVGGNSTEDETALLTPVQELMSGIWARMLRLNAVGARGNFFDLGGHSLLATQLISRVREVFGVEMPLASLFEAPVLADFATKVEAALRDGGGTVILPIVRRSPDQPLVLSYSQERLWFLDQLEPGNVAYNVPSRMRVLGSLDAATLGRTIGEIVGRHEALRTTFEMRDGRPLQVVHDRPYGELGVVDLMWLAEYDREETLKCLAREEAARPFDLTQWPLFRVKLVRMGAEDHVILFTLHHIISDGWSIEVLTREFLLLYDAFFNGRPSPLSELPVQYADYALWQREWLRGDVSERQLEYWKQQLQGIPAILALPTDRPRPLVSNHVGATRKIALSRELTEALRDLSRREGVTLFMTLSAAYKVLLHRYTGQDDIVVGTPVANRNRGEIENLIGCFLNTLILRSDLSGNPSFEDLLKREREVALGAYAHQEMPFEQLVQSFQLERSLSYNPLFQVMFVLQNNTQSEDVRTSGLRFFPWGLEHRTTKFDQSLLLRETPAGLCGNMDYSVDLFEADTIVRMTGHWERILERLAAQPGQSVSEMDLLTGAEREQILATWNATVARHEREKKLVHKLFEEHVARNPGAPAVADADRHLTYDELNRRANRIAHQLITFGVGPEVPVGICVERGIDWVVGLLGIMKAGGAYVPLDPAYPLDRLACMLEDSRAVVLLAESRVEERLPSFDGIVVYLDRDDAGTDAQPGNPDVALDGANLAYVMYTSGSTGRPKGVGVSHDGLLNLVNWHNRSYGIGPEDRATQLASIGFDASTWEVWPYLAAGASLQICGDEIRRSPAELMDWLAARQITISFLPTPLAEAVLAIKWSRPVALRRMLTGGDKLGSGPPASIPFELINHYGPTESAVVATAGRVGCRENTTRIPAIGRPIANTRIFILSRHGEPVPVGVVGEIHIGGDGLARGYMSRPELTADRFIPDRFSGEPGGRLYRTGDLARYLSDGEIEFLGRVDQQVKIRGFRIELGEIEAALRQFPGVRGCIASVWETGTDRQVVCYYCGDSVRPAALRDFLKDRLPEYMVPGVFMHCQEFPTTANGKIDRNRLPEPHIDRMVGDAVPVGPRNEIEEWMVNLWKTLLKQEAVGVTDSFFDLGGHSILATQVISEIREAYDVEISMRSFFQTPYIEDLAALMEQTFLKSIEPAADQEAEALG